MINTRHTLKEIIQLHADFGCDTILQSQPRNFYEKAKAEASPLPTSPSIAKAKASKPMTSIDAQQEALIGAIEAQKVASDVASKAQDLFQLRDALEKFEGCKSLSNTATQLVFSDGVSSSDVMIIGEAPGADEDKQGKPFVGVSGQLLDTMLSYIGLERAENCYISNMVFWRPPGNRPPTEEEMSICAPFVSRHIELVSPRIMLLLGNISVKRFFETSAGITKLRGSWRDYSISDSVSVPMLATFHPAYLLRNPLAKRDVWNDLRIFKTKLLELSIL